MRGAREGDSLLNDSRDFRCWPRLVMRGRQPEEGSVVDRAGFRSLRSHIVNGNAILLPFSTFRICDQLPRSPSLRWIGESTLSRTLHFRDEDFEANFQRVIPRVFIVPEQLSFPSMQCRDVSLIFSHTFLLCVSQCFRSAIFQMYLAFCSLLQCTLFLSRLISNVCYFIPITLHVLQDLHDY